MPKDWVRKYGPAIRVGLSVPRLGIGAARLSGVPLPDIADLGIQAVDEVQRRAAFLGQVCDGLRDELEGASLGGVVSWAEEQLDSVKKSAGAQPPPEAGVAIRQSYQHVVSLLSSLDGGRSVPDIVADQHRCGLVKAVCGSDGSVEWVAARWRPAYEKHGPRLLGLDEAERERLRTGGVGFAADASPSSSSSSSAPPGSLARQKSTGTLRRLLGQKTGASSDKMRGVASSKVREMYRTLFGSSSSLVQVEAAGEAEEEVVGLRAVLKAAKLDKDKSIYAKALKWCEENGAESIGYLKEVEGEAEFVEQLGLKKQQAKMLTKKLAEYVPPPSASGRQSSSSAGAVDAAQVQLTEGGGSKPSPLKRELTSEQLAAREAAAEKRKAESAKFKAEKVAAARGR